jgi:thymidylate synthase (FAD)
MNIVVPYARLMDVADLHDGIRLLKKIEWCGRISHRSEDAQTDDSWDRFIRTVVLGHGDWSIVEHASATVDMLVDRGITHEIVRHRLFSYTQESTRFVNYEKKMPPSFITGNLRNWRHFFIMRTTKEAHPQMRQVTIPLLQEFQTKIPILFEDIEPMAKQSESMKRAR